MIPLHLQQIVPIVRPFSPDDLNAVCKIEEESAFAPWTREGIIEAWENRFTTLLVACTNSTERSVAAEIPSPAGEIAGYICFRILFEELYIEKIAVLRRLSRMGIGTCLVDAALASGRENRAERCVLEVDRQNRAALALYKKLGFEPAPGSPRSSGQVTMTRPL